MTDTRWLKPPQTTNRLHPRSLLHRPHRAQAPPALRLWGRGHHLRLHGSRPGACVWTGVWGRNVNKRLQLTRDPFPSNPITAPAEELPGGVCSPLRCHVHVRQFRCQHHHLCCTYRRANGRAVSLNTCWVQNRVTSPPAPNTHHRKPQTPTIPSSTDPRRDIPDRGARHLPRDIGGVRQGGRRAGRRRLPAARQLAMPRPLLHQGQPPRGRGPRG